MDLAIVESPTKARKLTSFLNSNFVIRASYGHLRDLPKSKLGVDVENNFTPVYQLDKTRSKIINEIKKLAKKADKIYLATDPDREGEAIAWHIQEMLKDDVSIHKFVRSTFHEITKDAVIRAIENPEKLNLHLVEAQQARRILDRLVGYKASPILWRKVRRGLSAGRVQSVALRLLVEREREILSFKSEEYWELVTLLSLNKKTLVKTKIFDQIPQDCLLVNLFKINNKLAKIHNQSQADAADQALQQADYKVSDLIVKSKKRSSLPPLITSTMQQQAATRLGFSGSRTMKLAQNLYEEGLITYHRTDSVNLSSEAIVKIRQFISEHYGQQYLSLKIRLFKNKSKNAQEAHEAIRVTNFKQEFLDINRYKSLTIAHQKLYELIWRRTIACQMADALYQQTTVFVQAMYKDDVYLLKNSGSILQFDGFLKLFFNSGDVIFPLLNKEQKLFFQHNLVKQKFTEPPARYNDASLIKKLEELGIGRPSTYASIIEVLILRGYAERKEKKFFVSQIGMIVLDFLFQNLKQFLEYDFTAKMEDELDQIAQGKLEWQKVLKDFYIPFEKQINVVLEKVERVVMPVEETGQICPECGQKDGGKLVIRLGRFGKFKSCNRFPDCKYKESLVEKLEMKCPLCQKGEVIVKKTRFGKVFYGCSLYPKCDWASWQKPQLNLAVSQKEWEQYKEQREARRNKRKKSNVQIKHKKIVKKSKKIKKIKAIKKDQVIKLTKNKVIQRKKK